MKDLISFYRESGIFDEEQLQLISYAAKSIVNDISKLMILLSIAVLADTVILFLVVLIPFVTVRMLLGGIHMKSYWQCLIVTGGTLFGIMSISVLCANSILELLWGSVISILGIAYVGPQVSSRKRILTKKRREVFRKSGLMLEFFLLFFTIGGIQNEMYQAGILLTLLISNVQILILYRKERENA